MSGLNEIIEFKSGEYRPCIVHNKKALFHRWIDNDHIVLKDNTRRKPESLDSILQLFEQKQVVDISMTFEKVRDTLAIIEFQDGSIKTVCPAEIRFLDSRELFLNVVFEQEGEKYVRRRDDRTDQM